MVDTENSAGTGNGVEMRDFDPTLSTGNTALEYNFVASLAEGESLVRCDFSIAYKGGSAAGTNYMSVGFGEFNEALSLNASANRWNDMRLYDTGLMTPGDTSLLPSNSAHTVTVFINDLPDKINYIGPDTTTNGLNGDSVAYWVDDALTAVSLLDVGDIGAGGAIGETTNNFGKFGITSPSDDEGLNYVFDDIEISTFDTVYVAPEIIPESILYVTFEDDIVGTQPTVDTPDDLIRPSPNQPDYFVKVVGESENLAGSGKGVQIYDGSATAAGIAGLEYNIVNGLSEHVSAVRVDFDFAYVSTNASFNKPIHFGLGEYDAERSFGSSRERYTDVRFYADGTIDFRRNAPPGTDSNDFSWVSMSAYPDSQNNPVTPGSHSLSIFVNDYQNTFVDYTGPDGDVYTLPTNSVAYWLDGEVVMMTDEDETNAYIVMDLFDYAYGRMSFDLIGETENNLGKIGFVSESTGGWNNDWVFDNILVSTNLLFVVDSWEKWLSLYPEVGVQTNYLDDVEPDGMDNLTECAWVEIRPLTMPKTFCRHITLASRAGQTG